MRKTKHSWKEGSYFPFRCQSEGWFLWFHNFQKTCYLKQNTLISLDFIPLKAQTVKLTEVRIGSFGMILNHYYV